MAKLDGKIILIAGGAGNVGEGIVATFLEETAAELPLPRISPVGITAAGQLMMVRILIEETKGSGVRINEVIVQGMVRTRVMQSHSSPEWITPTEIGEFAVWLASDEAYMVSGGILHLNQRPR